MGPDKTKIEALEKRMAAIGIKKKDIKEKFIKGSGKGGQKVNKTSSAVFLRHTKMNISIKCSKSRSQHLNRFLALRMLIEKIEYKIAGLKDKKAIKVAKIKKQKKRRKRKTLKKQISDG